MKMMFPIAILGMVSACGAPHQTTSIFDGYSGRHSAQVARPYIWYPTVPTNASVESFISSNNAEIQPQTIQDLATELLTVANCFQIDARMLTSQIRQESLFDANAESVTHAVGLSQLTRIGIAEIEDQLGRRGPDNANPTAISYFKGVIAGCLQDHFAGDFASQTLLWERPEVQQSESRKKEILKEEPRMALTYGAILLKTLLSKARVENAAWTTKEVFGRALWYYNGDPAAQAQYSAVILERAAAIP